MNQILYTGEQKKKVIYRKEGMILISMIFIIIIATILSFYISSWNKVSEATFQNQELANEVVLSEKTIENNSIEKINVILENSEKENEIKEEAKVETENSETKKTAIQKPVTKKVKTSNGKSYDTIATLKIPSLNIEYPVLSSTSTELLKISLNKYWGANPNEVGNMCIVGHNYNDSRFFGNLNKIKKGANIQITDMKGKTLNYKVYHTEMVDPYDTSCTSQLTNGKIEITLITCNYDGSKRFVVKARAN